MIQNENKVADGENEPCTLQPRRPLVPMGRTFPHRKEFPEAGAHERKDEEEKRKEKKRGGGDRESRNINMYMKTLCQTCRSKNNDP